MKDILIIDNSIFSQTKSKYYLNRSNYNIVGTALDGDSGINLALDHDPDVIILDNVLPDMEGIDVLQILKSEGLEKDVLLVLPQNQQLFADNTTRLGAKDYIIRPFTEEMLIEKLLSF